MMLLVGIVIGFVAAVVIGSIMNLADRKIFGE